MVQPKVPKYWYKRKTRKGKMIKNMLTRRKESNTYLATVSRHRYRRQIAMKVYKMCSFQPVLWPSSGERCHSLSFLLIYFLRFLNVLLASFLDKYLSHNTKLTFQRNFCLCITLRHVWEASNSILSCLPTNLHSI